MRGQLLVAGPGLVDPNFWRTVVLIAEHTEEGAMGVVLNRPSETSIGEAVPQLVGVSDPDELIHVGGPVQPSAIVVLAEFDDPAQAATVVLDDVGFVAVGTELEDVAEHTRRARVFAGHSGWGPGQLDAEIETGDWIVVEAEHEDAFSDEPGELWRTVLERKGGQYALLARMPLDPSMN